MADGTAQPSADEAGLPRDRAAHHAWLVSLTALPNAGVIADLGCGRGDDLRLLAARYPGVGVRLIGVDISDAAEEGVTVAAAVDDRISFRRSRLDGMLPFEDASLDLVFSHNLVECLPDPGAFAHEVARVLRPGGQAVIAHWDWDSQLFDGTDKRVVRRLVAAYADWQQAWMDHADGWMGRRLWGVFNATRRFDGAIHARALINTAYEPPWFGYANAAALASLVKRGLASADDHDVFMRDQEALYAEGRYFYSITGYAFAGVLRSG